jgi:hypothetical protein
MDGGLKIFTRASRRPRARTCSPKQEAKNIRAQARPIIELDGSGWGIMEARYIVWIFSPGW